MASIDLTITERDALAQALQSAYHNQAELEQLVFFGLGERLDALAAPGALPARVMALVQWAEASGRADELVRVAHERRPGNPRMRELQRRFLDAARRSRDPREPPEGSAIPPARKHTILFLAANPGGTDPHELGREARSIQRELEQAGHRDRFDFETRWAAEPLDLLRELRKLKPTVVHFSGRGGQSGLFFRAADGCARLVSPEALAETFAAAGASVRLVVLGACYTDEHARALLAHVDCVVGMGGAIRDDAARSFAIGFYGGLGELESVEAAYKQGCAAISLEGLAAGERPQWKVREGDDANRLVLAAGPP